MLSLNHSLSRRSSKFKTMKRKQSLNLDPARGKNMTYFSLDSPIEMWVLIRTVSISADDVVTV